LSYPQNQLNEVCLFPLEINQIIDVIDDLAEAVYGVDLEGKCTFCNKQTLSLLQYDSVKQLLGQNMQQLIHHSNLDGSVKTLADFKLQKSLQDSEIIHKSLDWVWRQDGTSLPVEIWSYPYHKNDNVCGAIVAFIDISERLQVQKTLEKSLERYRMLIESTQVVPWEYDLISQRFTFISPQAEEMFGYPLTDWYKGQFWEQHIHPDDLSNVLSACIQTTQQKSTYELEYRMFKSDNSVFYVKDYVNVISRNGSPVGLRGIFTDISTSKIQEEELRLAAVTFETDSGIIISDTNGRIIKVNSAFSEITGFSEEEALSKSTNLLKSGEHDSQFYQRMWSDLKKHGRWQGEIWNKRKSGEVFPEWLTISAVRNASHITSHYVAIFTDISEIKKAEAKIQYQAHFDELTGLPNRASLINHLKQAITQARKFYHYGALLLLDLDEFKIINDSLGHTFGDKLLRKVAVRISKLVSGGDIVARLGGDEFAILLPDLGGELHDSQITAEQFAQQVCKALLREYTVTGQSVHLSTCIGISIFSRKKVSHGDVLKQADTAMYKAKSLGKNCRCNFTDDMQQEADKRLTLQNELKIALKKDQLELHFQPQFDNLQKLSGMEALVRWNHPSKGLIPPNDFIPVAEKSGLIIQLGRWVLENACEIYADWLVNYKLDNHDGNLPRMSINVSAQQFQQASFPNMVLNCLTSNNLGEKHLELEITEEVLIGDIEQTISVIKYLKDRGVNFAIDDFGTGYSSLSYLKKLPIDLLKVDRSFIMNIPEDKDDIAITKTIISMANHLNLNVIAEGVENLQQFEFLKQQGCNFYQGFYFSRPLARLEFENQILSSLKLR
jgi:diguanylate cyclase (GGDEF)-like protein/PAS domain S-box-containing protein